MKRAFALMLTLLSISVLAQEEPQTVTIEVSNRKVSTVCERIVKQTNVRMLLEKTAADVEVSLSVTDMPLEDALTAICKPVKLSW